MDYDKCLNPEVLAMKPSGIRRFFDIAETMTDVVSLGVGEPDFATPWKIRAAAMNALENGKTKYTANRGLKPLRETIAKYLERKFDLSYKPESEILLTVGGSEAIDLVFRAVLSPGDEVIIPQPSYVCYEPLTRLSGGVPVVIETKAEDEFRLTAKDLKAALTPKTKLLVLPYPCNPTGAVMDKASLEEIAEVLRGTNVFVLSDEIYAELTFGGKHVSIASLPAMRERTVVISGFSKTFSMTGWRLGYAAGPEPVLKAATKIHQYAIMCAPTVSQYAAIAAMTECDDDVAAMLEEYDMRRRFMVRGFNDLGLRCRNPRGAFYAFPEISCTGLTSEAFCEELLKSERVALVPGTAFGASGEGFVRASYCYSLEHVKKALSRIERFLAARGLL